MDDGENKIKIEYIETLASTIDEPRLPIGRNRIVTETEFKLTEGYTFHSTLEFEETRPTKPDPDLCLRPTTSPDAELNRSRSRPHSDMNTDSRLNKRSPPQFECDVCVYKTKSRSHLRQHLQRHAGARKFACSQCPKKFYTTSEVKQHVRGVHTGEKPFICDICSVGFAIRTNLQQHIRIHIRKMNTELPTYVCYICGDGVKYQRRVYLDIHMKQSHFGGTALHSCNICSERFLSKNGLKRHLAVHHHSNTTDAPSSDQPSENATVKLFKCSQCEYSTKYSNHLKIHSRVHSGEKPYRCDHFPAAFSSTSHLKRHQRTLHIKPHLKCNECPRKFGDMSELNQHVRIKHQGIKMPRKFACNICPLRTVSKNNLEKHLRTHTNERPFKCPTCSKGFTVKTNMERHARDVKCHLHKKHEAIKCLHCSKVFKTDGSLRRHETIFTCTRTRTAYECFACPTRFEQLCALKLHLRTHDTESTTHPHCSKVLKTKVTLNRHMRNVKCTRRADNKDDGMVRIKVSSKRLARNLQCSHCRFRFSIYDSLADHMKKIHGISIDCSLEIRKI